MLSIAILVLTCFVNLLLGLLVLTRNPRSASGRAFFGISVFIGLWAASNYLTDQVAIGLSLVSLFNRLSFVFALLVIYCGVWFTYDFFSSVRPPKSISIGLNLLVAALVLLSASNGVAGRVSLVDGQLNFSIGTLLPVYILALVGLFAIIARNLIHRIAKGDSKQRQQAIYVLAGFTIPAVLGILTNAALPLATDSWQSATLGPIFTVILVATIAYAITRHQLFDIRFFVVRAAAYLVTLLVMTFVFIAPFVVVLNYVLGRTLSAGQFLLVLLASVCLLYILQYLRRFFDRLTAKVFFRHYYDPQDVLDRVSDVLVRTADLNILSNETSQILKDALRPGSIRYLLAANGSRNDINLIQRLDKYASDHSVTIVDADDVGGRDHGFSSLLRSANIALAVKLHTTHEDLGYIVLGHKLSGELYNDRDRRLLAVAADEIAISLQNVLRFEQIQRFNVTLQEEVDTATRKLKRQNKRLEELDDIKDDFISMASHQLRTPLTSVKGYLSMVLDGDAGKLTKDQNMMLKQAFASSQRMVFLITDLLNVSRLKTGKFVIDAVPTNLKDVVQQELAQLKETAAAKNLELVYKPPKTFPELMLDEVKIRQVIMNFVDNAIYYTPAGGRIKVELIERPNAVELRVVDNGIGVPRSEQPHLFTKFYRATNARTARPDGTGLGLFMAQKVIVAQGGSVIFSSREGQGSTFGFSFSKSKLANLNGSASNKVEAMPVVAAHLDSSRP